MLSSGVGTRNQDSWTQVQRLWERHDIGSGILMRIISERVISLKYSHRIRSALRVLEEIFHWEQKLEMLADDSA